MIAIKNQKKNYKKIIKYILSFPNEVNIEDKNFEGDTALMLSVYSGNFELVKTLVEKYNANPNTRENLGFTPFIAACAN
jgi:ankyrin repeat protein